MHRKLLLIYGRHQSFQSLLTWVKVKTKVLWFVRCMSSPRCFLKSCAPRSTLLVCSCYSEKKNSQIQVFYEHKKWKINIKEELSLEKQSVITDFATFSILIKYSRHTHAKTSKLQYKTNESLLHYILLCILIINLPKNPLIYICIWKTNSLE